MSIDDITPPGDQRKDPPDAPERHEPPADPRPAAPSAADDLIQKELPWGDATKTNTAANPAESPALMVEVSDVHGVRIPAEERTPRMEDYARQETQPLIDFSGLTPDQIVEREPITGDGFGSGSMRAQEIGKELADLYRDAPSSRVSIGQTRAAAVDLNARGLSQDDAITAWKVFYSEALEAHGPSYRYADGCVVISAASPAFTDVIVVDPRGVSAPGSTTDNDIGSGTLGTVSPRLPGRDLSGS